MNWYQRLLVRGGWVFLLLGVAAAVWAGGKLPLFSVEAGTDVLLNEDDEDLAFYNKTRSDWEYDEYIIVCATKKDWFTPEGVALLSELLAALKKLPHAKSILSIADVPLRDKLGAPTAHLTDPGYALELARQELVNHTQARGNLVSTNGEDVSVLVYLTLPEVIIKFEAERNQLLLRKDAEAKKRLAEINPPYQLAKADLGRRRLAFVTEARALAEKWNPKFDQKIRISGLSFINILLMEHIQSDIVTFGILSFALFTLAYLVIYRRLRWVILPVVTCVLPVAIMIALMVVSGKVVTVVTSNMPVLLFVLMLPYSVYFIERYGERRAGNPGEDPRITSTKAPLEIWPPCLYSCLATMAGTIAHMPSGINPVRTFGLMMTIGMGIGLAILMLFLPATVVPLKGVDLPGRGVANRATGPLRWLELLVLRRPRGVVIVSLVILGISLWGTSKLNVETKFIDYFWPSSPIYQGLDYIDKKMGGTTPLEILLRSDQKGFFRTEEGLKAMASAASFFDKVPETGNVRSVRSLLDEIKKGRPALDDESALELLEENAPGLIREFNNKDDTVSRVLVRMRETAPTLNRNRILLDLNNHLKSLPELKGLEARPTGVFLLYSNMLNTLIAATRETFILAVIAIFVMLCWLFRSAKISILVLLPQVLPVFLVLGTMGITGIALDMVTVIIASVAMGVGIDAAIQYTVRFRTEVAATNGDYAEAVSRSHATIGRAILIATSIVFTGFAILMLSNFVPTFYFGMFTGLAILMGLYASLTTLPALFLLLKPRFTSRPHP